MCEEHTVNFRQWIKQVKVNPLGDVCVGNCVPPRHSHWGPGESVWRASPERESGAPCGQGDGLLFNVYPVCIWQLSKEVDRQQNPSHPRNVHPNTYQEPMETIYISQCNDSKVRRTCLVSKTRGSCSCLKNNFMPKQVFGI